MRILKALVWFDDANGAISEADAIEYQGGIWIVAGWLENPTARTTSPVRIIRVDQMQHQQWGDRLVLNEPLPRAVYDGRQKPPPGSAIVVIEEPDVSMPWAPGIH